MRIPGMLLPRSLIVFALLCVSHPAMSEAVVAQRFAMPGGGSLRLDVPGSWQVRTSRVENPPALSFLFAAPGTPDFQVFLTAVATEQAGVAPLGPAEMRQQVTQIADSLKPRAVETDIPIETLRGPAAAGYYFTVTDSAPKPGEYKYMTQGIARVGPLEIVFTLLTNDAGGTVTGDTIRLLRSGAYETAGRGQSRR